MANFLRMSATSAGSACTRAASCETPRSSAAWVTLKLATLAGSAVSSSVPSTKTMRMSRSVWKVFCATPQHMPELLLETMPPIMQESMELGSGPILYVSASLCFLA